MFLSFLVVNGKIIVSLKELSKCKNDLVNSITYNKKLKL
jgi:hypothetical protein